MMKDVVKLFVGPVWTTVVTDSEDAEQIIDSALTVLDPARFYSKKYQYGLWDGKVRFYNRLRCSFLTGFLDMVLHNLYRRGYIVELEYLERGKPERIDIEDVDLNGIDKERWRMVQLPLLKEMLKVGRGVVKLATGGGKTEIIAGLVKVINKPSLILVHRLELHRQTIQRLEQRIGEKVGSIASDEIDLRRVNVGMVLSVWSKRMQLRQFLNKVEVVVSDECHRSSSNTWSKVLEIIPATYRFGLSGTPLKGDRIRDMMLVGLTGRVMSGIGVKELADAGYAVLPEVRLLNIGKKIVGKYQYNEVYNLVYKSTDFWDVLIDVIRWHNKSGLIVFSERLDICEGFCEYARMKLSDKVVEVSNGKMSKKDRVDTLERFKNGDIDVLVVTTILDEGIDVSSVSGVVFLTSNKCISRVLQRIGRGVRVDENKDRLYVYDFLVNAPYLKSHVLSRCELYVREGFNVVLYDYVNGSFVRRY